MTTATIHDTALVASDADIANDVAIGPYCVIHENVSIGPGTILRNHVTVFPNVTMGARNEIWPNVVLGGPPQDISPRDPNAQLLIGDENVIREGVTMHVASAKADRITRVGSRNYFMAYSHVAHDCQVGDDIMLSQSALLAGHVVVQHHAILCGGAAVHQFVRVGAASYVGGLTRIVQDVPPFMIVEGHPSRVRGVNVIGMRRRGACESTISALKAAYRALWCSNTLRTDAFQHIRETVDMTPEVEYLLEYMERTSEGNHGRYLEAFRR